MKPAWCGNHLAGLRPEQGLQPVTKATAFEAVAFWSFYIISSGSGLNEGGIGDLKAEDLEQCRLLRHFLAQQRDEV
ncbi:MAG: hypothetical protein LC126_07405 [Bryobacterales bacterium]|nr:hypothetical protein [Bryobacterales bacterium]